jgi:hypothetical protein
MNHPIPYTSLHVEARRATQRLSQVFQGRDMENPVSLELDDAPVVNREKKGLSPKLTGQNRIAGDLGKQPARESDSSREDMSSFSFTLTLLLSGTIAAANAEHPLFWLLIGPTPLAVGLAAVIFLRRLRLGRSLTLPAVAITERSRFF